MPYRKKITTDILDDVRLLTKQGWTVEKIGFFVRIPVETVIDIQQQNNMVVKGKLTYSEREQIKELFYEGATIKEIADRLHREYQTIYETMRRIGLIDPKNK